jgi:hypothetical protein
MSYGNYAPFYRGGYFNPMQSAQMQMPNLAENQGQYVPQYQQQMPMQNSAPMSQPINDMIWVLNENEATSYPVAPNNSVVLWDKSNPTIYVKSVNASGMPSMRVLDFTERSAESQNNGSNGPKAHHCTCGDKFATKEQINDLRGKIDDLTAKYEELSHPVIEKTKTTAKKSKEIDE